MHTNTASPRKLWDNFCAQMGVDALCVPLFAQARDGVVETKQVGTKQTRSLLCRSDAMEQLVLAETDKLVLDYQSGGSVFDGMIYMMLLKEQGELVPLYIGKTETYGKSGDNLSANLKNLRTDRSKFARWGDGYAYHIGDLSAVVLGHTPDKQTKKYTDWADALFVVYPTDTPRLRQEVFFWAMAWQEQMGPFQEFGPVRLAFLEYQLIGIAAAAFPQRLLNQEGRMKGR